MEHIMLGDEATFIGGSNYTLIFYIQDANGLPLNISNTRSVFALARHGNPNFPIFEVPKAGVIDTSDPLVKNKIKVDLLPTDTVDLKGRFIFQLQIYKDEDEFFIPAQGNILIISKVK